MKQTRLKLNGREAGVAAGVAILVAAVLFTSLIMAFEHAKAWYGRHDLPDTPGWEGWAFAIMIELPAIMGLLLLALFRWLAPRKKPTLPKVLFFSAALVSFLVQQAYAGDEASMSTRIGAGLPSIVAALFIHIGFKLVEMIDEALNDPGIKATVGAPASVPPPPRLVSPPPPPVSTRTPAANVPGHVAPDITAEPHVSPWTQPPTGRDMSPDTDPDITADVPRTSGVGHQDIPQFTATVHPSHVHPTEEDTETDVLPAGPGDTSPSNPLDMSRDSEDTDGGTPDDQANTDADVPDPDETPDTDTDDPDTEVDKPLDPRAFEALSMRTEKAMTNPQIAAHFGCSTKTVQRLIKQATDAQQEPALAGSR